VDDTVNMKSVQLSVEGSSLAAAGGWAYQLRFGAHTMEDSGCSPLATGPRMELQAAVEGFRRLNQPCNVRLMAHSSFVLDGIAALPKRHARGWKMAGNHTKDLKHLDLWSELFELTRKHTIVCQRLKGQYGYPDSIRCDKLDADPARIQAAEPFLVGTDRVSN